MEVSQAQTSVRENAAKDVKTDSEVSSDESEEEVVEEKKKQPEVIEEKKPESKADQKPVTKSRPVASTPIPDTVWCVVRTNDGKHFFYNPTKRQSVWKMPEELKNRPDVEKLLLPKPEVKTKKKEEKDLQEEPPSKKLKLEAEVKEMKAESNNEITQETVLEKKTTNAVEVQAAENILFVSLEDRKKKFKELLVEKDVLTASTWEKELHKVIFDQRYTLLTAQECKQAFEEYVKDQTEVKHKKRWRVNKNSEIYRIMQSFEESDLNVKLEAEVKEKKAESNNEVAQQTVLEKETTNAVKVQAAENMPVVSLDDRKKQFKELLAEKDVSTYSTWETEMLKVIFDKRYILLTSEERRQTFGEYVKTRAEENYKESCRNAKEHSELYRQLLEESDLNVKSTFQSFAAAHSHDKRFKNIVILSNRMNMFKDYINELSQQEKEMTKLVKKKVRIGFMTMLSETPGIDQDTSWKDVRRKLNSDPRYKAAIINSRRMQWFWEYLKTENVVKDDFMKILSEIPDINRSTGWGIVKNKVSSDPRYKAISDTRQLEWFITYLMTVKNVKSNFMKMLSEIPDVNPNTSWGDVKNKVSADPRYKNISDTRQEEWFKAYLKTVKDVKDNFMKMLSEIPDVNTIASWGDVKNKVSSDLRYKAVSDTCREEWFKTYLKTVKDVVPDDIRKEEVQEKQLHSSSAKGKNTSSLNREAAFEDFKQFLVKKVKDTKNAFTTFKARFLINPRWTMELSEKEMKNLYDSHINEMLKKNREILWSILDDMNLSLEAQWSEVKKQVEADPNYVNYTDSEEQLADDYALFMKEKILKNKKEFQKLLSEMELITSGTKIMLQQKSFTMSDVVYFIMQDQRYSALDSDSEQREQRLLAYINEFNEKNQTPR